MALDEEDIDLKDIQIEKKIGKGTFGDVYSGTLKTRDIKVAVKRVNKQTIMKYGNDYLVNAFFKELECMRKCNCENSVRLLKNYETVHNYNIIMELCDGDLMQELSKRANGFSTEEIKDIMSQLNNAFRKLHENNLIHRDLKLGNVLIKFTNKEKTKFIPKLCDYGFSKELNKTSTGTHLGTPATMAPEVMKDKPYNSKADLWSIGVIIYQLHFKGLPFPGVSEKAILTKIQNKNPYKQAEDPKLRDLIDKLLVEDPEKRLSWEEYFNHPFFAKEEQTSSTTSTTDKIIKKTRYSFLKDFDVGFKNDSYKCYIAMDQKRNKKVIIKSYSMNFIKSHEIFFKIEYELSKAFKGNERILQLINVFNEETEKTTNLVYNYIDAEILSSYITYHDFTEKELQKLNKELFENIFIFNECNFKSFIFISIYSFAITKEGKPILFDFGLSKFFLNPDELMSYYIPNKGEIGNTLFPTKTNVMNYGITLLKCFYGNKLKIEIDKVSFDLPKNKIISKNFSNFLSQCLFRDISKRGSWNSLNNHEFVKEIIGDNVLLNKNLKDDAILIDNYKLDIIFESLDNKFRLINEYYGNLEFNEKTEYIKEIEIFLILTIFEQLMILKVFDRKENEPFTSQQEISFITIKKNSNSSRINLNFANPIFNNMKIVQISNNELISKFLLKLTNYIRNLKKISLEVHKITKSSLMKGNYHIFLEQFIDILESSNFHNYFFSIVKKAHKFFEEKDYEKAYKEIPVAEYICECILFVKASLFESNNDKIYFNNKDLINQLNEIFDEEKESNKIEISVLKISDEKKKYVLISFLGVLFRFFKNSTDINQYFLQLNKVALDGLMGFYPSLMKLLVDTKNKLKK